MARCLQDFIPGVPCNSPRRRLVISRIGGIVRALIPLHMKTRILPFISRVAILLSLAMALHAAPDPAWRLPADGESFAKSLTGGNNEGVLVVLEVDASIPNGSAEV